MKPTSAPEIFLRRQRRRTHGTPLALAVAAGLLAVAWVGAVRLGWLRWTPLWAIGPAALGVYLLIEWVKRVWQRGTPALARECDARWELKGRMEAALELAGSDSAVAVAQRLDTARQLETVKPSGTFRWLGGMAAALIGLGVVGIESAVLLRRAQPAPVTNRPAASSTAAARGAGPTTPEPGSASIVWRSPGQWIQAKPLDAIPLVARVESNRGLQSLSLEVAVNGTRTNSYPVAPGILESLARAGGADLKLSLYLDETGAQPDDVVSYYLQGRAKAAPAVPDVFSPQQFAEVTDSANDAGYSAADRDVLNRLNALKRAELPLLEQNSELIRAKQAQASGNRADENAGVAAAQSALAQTADEVAGISARSEASSPLAAGLSQASRLMSQAGDALAAKSNEAAALLQAKALAQMAEAERTFRQRLNARGTGEPAVALATSREVKLQPRESTPAGRLEQLARRQADGTRRLQQTKSDPADQQAITTLQNSIAHDAEKLAAEHRLLDSVQSPLDKGDRAAADAARQLGLNDLAAAKEPAVQAQTALQQAVEAQEAEGRKSADALLERVRRELNTAAADDEVAQKTQIEASRRELAAEAERQQDQGSAKAAEQLAQLANQLGASTPSQPSTPKPTPKGSSAYKYIFPASDLSNGRKAMPSLSMGATGNGNAPSGTASDDDAPRGSDSGPPNSAESNDPGSMDGFGGGGLPGASPIPAEGERPASAGGSSNSVGGTLSPDLRDAGAKNGDVSVASDAAAIIADAQAALAPDEALARTIRQLGVVGDGLSGHGFRYDPPPFYLIALDSALQEAPYISHNPEVVDIVRQIAKARGGIRPNATSPAELTALADLARQLAHALEQARAGGQPRDEWVRRFSPEAIDPDYRQPVETYFERLSREGAKP